MQPCSILSLVLLSSMSSFLVTCYHSTFFFMFFHFHSVSLACTTSSSLSIFPFLLLCLPRHVSPLSFLFYALSDMSQDSSDEDSEEEEDFARVQFGSRYTAARCVFACLCVLAQLCVHCMFQWAQKANCTQTHQGRVVKNKSM